MEYIFKTLAFNLEAKVSNIFCKALGALYVLTRATNKRSLINNYFTM